MKCDIKNHVNHYFHQFGEIDHEDIFQGVNTNTSILNYFSTTPWFQPKYKHNHLAALPKQPSSQHQGVLCLTYFLFCFGGIVLTHMYLVILANKRILAYFICKGSFQVTIAQTS